MLYFFCLRREIHGNFSKKATCAVCGQECGLNRFKIKNKLWVCSKCFVASGLTVTSIVNMTPDTIRSMISKREANANKLASFKATKNVAGFLKVDESAREWCIPNGLKKTRIHSYDEVLDFELLEDGGSIVKGGLGRAVVGGVLFGDVGAIVGGVTGGRKGKSTCSSLKIKITLNDITAPIEYINLITTETKKNSKLYKTCERQAQEILSLFQVMCESNKMAQSAEASVIQKQSAADEIVKFKQLLDSGVITEEEFKVKKRQLLEI